MEAEIIKAVLPKNKSFTRQEICEIAETVDTEFNETLLRNMLEKLLKNGDIVRVAQNRYIRNDGVKKKQIYENRYSEEAEKIITEMKRKYPLLDFRVWELRWLNEFWNHQIAMNKIFLEVEKMGCDFVYAELGGKYQGRMLLKPNEDELYRYGGNNTIVIERLVSEAPKGVPERYNTPLEKIIVDLFANQKLRSMTHTGEYAAAISDMFEKYGIDQSKMFRYANRRNKKQELFRFLKQKTNIEVQVGVNNHA